MEMTRRNVFKSTGAFVLGGMMVSSTSLLSGCANLSADIQQAETDFQTIVSGAIAEFPVIGQKVESIASTVAGYVNQAATIAAELTGAAESEVTSLLSNGTTVLTNLLNTIETSAPSIFSSFTSAISTLLPLIEAAISGITALASKPTGMDPNTARQYLKNLVTEK